MQQKSDSNDVLLVKIIFDQEELKYYSSVNIKSIHESINLRTVAESVHRHFKLIFGPKWQAWQVFNSWAAVQEK